MTTTNMTPPTSTHDRDRGVKRDIVWYDCVDMGNNIVRHAAVERRGNGYAVLLGYGYFGHLCHWVEIRDEQAESKADCVALASGMIALAEESREARRLLSKRAREQNKRPTIDLADQAMVRALQAKYDVKPVNVDGVILRGLMFVAVGLTIAIVVWSLM